jgi:hypothetical protein
MESAAWKGKPSAVVRNPLSAKVFRQWADFIPVKKRAMSELNEFDALTPKIVSRIPPARSASETAFSCFSFHAVSAQLNAD